MDIMHFNPHYSSNSLKMNAYAGYHNQEESSFGVF